MTRRRIGRKKIANARSASKPPRPRASPRVATSKQAERARLARSRRDAVPQQYPSNLLTQIEREVTEAELNAKKKIAGLPARGLIRAPRLPDPVPTTMLLSPWPPDLGLSFNRYRLSFPISDGKHIRLDIQLYLARALRLACRLTRNTARLTESQRIALGHNIGVLRMLLRADSDQAARIGQAKHANEYRAQRRAGRLFSNLKEVLPDKPYSSDDPNVVDVNTIVMWVLESEGLGQHKRSTIDKWRRQGTPKAERRRGRRKKGARG